MTQELKTKIKNIQQDCLAKLKELRLQAQKEIILIEIEDRGEHFYIRDKVLREDEEIALAFVTKQGKNLKYLPKFQNNKKIVLAAVKENGWALEYASEELRNDPEVVLEAIKCKRPNSWFALKYANQELKDNREIALEALKKQYQSPFSYRGEVLSHVGIKLSNKILELAIQHLEQK